MRKVDPDGLTYEGAAKRLGVTKQRIQQFRARGQLPSLKPEDIDAFDRDRKTQAKAKAEYWAARNAAMLEHNKRELVFWDELIEVLKDISRSLSLLVASSAANTASRFMPSVPKASPQSPARPRSAKNV